MIAHFLGKLHEQWIAGNIEAAITLTHNYTDTNWFQAKLVPIASAICFTYGRVKFYEGDHIAQPTQGQALAFVAWRQANIRSDGRPSKNGDGTDTVLMSDKEITESTGIAKKQAERMRSKLKAPDKYRAYLLGSEYMAAFLEPAQNVRGTMGTGENEWFTPEQYIDAAGLLSKRRQSAQPCSSASQPCACSRAGVASDARTGMSLPSARHLSGVTTSCGGLEERTSDTAAGVIILSP
jgi:hypothetical protein